MGKVLIKLMAICNQTKYINIYNCINVASRLAPAQDLTCDRATVCTSTCECDWATMELSLHTKQKLANMTRQTCPDSPTAALDEGKFVCRHGSVIYAVAHATYVHRKCDHPPPPLFQNSGPEVCFPPQAFKSRCWVEHVSNPVYTGLTTLSV